MSATSGFHFGGADTQTVCLSQNQRVEVLSAGFLEGLVCSSR